MGRSFRRTCRCQQRLTNTTSTTKKVLPPVLITVQGYAEADEEGRVTREPYSLKNGATYTGQWLNELRDGYGVQVWPDGSIYEGMWREDKANG